MKTFGLVMVLMLAGDVVTDGVAAYRAGRFDEALRVFTEAEARAGVDAGADLLYNRALAALAAGSLRDAEIAMEKAVARGGPGWIPVRDFVLGNITFKRCERAELLAARPEGGPMELDAAIVHARRALRLWQSAALGREDWPAARRNAERAALKLEELEEKKKAAAKKKAPKEKPKPEEKPPERDPQEERRTIEAQTTELSPEQVKRLLDKLGQKEKEKRDLRRSLQADRRVPGERDW